MLSENELTTLQACKSTGVTEANKSCMNSSWKSTVHYSSQSLPLFQKGRIVTLSFQRWFGQYVTIFILM